MHAGTIYQHLKSNELFKTTPENALTDLSNGVHSTVFQPGQSIFTKNDVADAMYIIASGTVKIHDGEVVIATFGAGAFFGELSLLDSGLRSLSATAEEETELLQISRDAVFNIFKKDPKVLMNLVSEIVRRMRKQDEEMVGQLKSREKVLENLVAERTAQLEEKNEALKNALVTLQSTQKQLVLKEKLATLNEISAEIAHEIQNPLNFVNNFSEINMELSNEILAGLNEVTLPDDVLADFNDIFRNNQAIAEHGKRASNIVSKLLKQARKAEALKSMPVV